MIITFELGPEFQAELDKLNRMGAAIGQAVNEGLADGGDEAVNHTVETYLSGQALSRRTGTLARELDSWLAGDYDLEVGIAAGAVSSKYAWLLSDQTRTIVPTSAKFLAIPIGENRTGTGLTRFKSPRDVPGGFFVRSNNQLLFGYKQGQRGRFRPLFILKRTVTIIGSGALVDGVLDSVEGIAGKIEERLNQIDGMEAN